MTVNILGTEYEIIEATAAEDAMLEKCELSENFTHPEYGHDETYVDWIVSQFPKMCEVFKEVGCL